MLPALLAVPSARGLPGEAVTSAPAAGHPGYTVSSALNYRRRCVGRAARRLTARSQQMSSRRRPTGLCSAFGAALGWASCSRCPLPTFISLCQEVSDPSSNVHLSWSLPPPSSMAPTCPQLKLSAWAGQEALVTWLCLFSSLTLSPPFHGDSL